MSNKKSSSQDDHQTEREQGHSQYEDWPKDELLKQAEEAGIEGASGKSKEELVAALSDE